MNRITWKERFQYWLDNLMAKGSGVLVGVLFLATTLVIVVLSIILCLIDRSHTVLLENFWISLMHVIDPGTITGAELTNGGFIILMSVATLCGIFITSILIGIITTGFEAKLTSLSKGTSRVLEKNHTVILGYNSGIYTLLTELIAANENQKDGCIVILSEEDKAEIEEKISSYIGDTKTTRIIYRSGSISDPVMLSRCSIEQAKSIIINVEDDAITTKSVVAIHKYFNEIQHTATTPHIVSTVQQKDVFDAIQVMTQNNAEIILVTDTISRIIAQSCRQPGLSIVLLDLFDYGGDELYFECFPQLDGEVFADVMLYFDKAVVFGLVRNNKVILNPPSETILESSDQLILFMEDDHAVSPQKIVKEDCHLLYAIQEAKQLTEKLLIIGSNTMLESILLELDQYYTAEAQVIIADHTPENAWQNINHEFQYIQCQYISCDTTKRTVLEEILTEDINHVLVLSNEQVDLEQSDAEILMKLIYLSDIIKQQQYHCNITSEMSLVSNQKLAEGITDNDLVVGSNILNLILAQVSENRQLCGLFQELLSYEGNEIRMEKASNYFQLDKEMNFYQATEIMKKNHRILIGYKSQVGTSFQVVMNPLKSERFQFHEMDDVICISKW